MNQYKEIAAEAGAEQLENGMIVGLGSGTTSELALAAIGRRVAQGLRITGIPTSEKIAGLARGLGIPLATLAEHPQVDITVDGADEVETGTLNLIKGGGGNLLREKIVAASSARLVIVADESKVVRQLGLHWAIPVEVIPFGWQATASRLKRTGANPVLRVRDGQTYITDGGHYILDCAYGPIHDARALQTRLDSTVGVVEHGLFIGMASEAIIGGAAGVTRMRRP
jgi:ribose 5-phosphate isomerase A